MIKTFIEVKEFNKVLQSRVYLVPTIWYEREKFNKIAWHTLSLGFLNFIFTIELEVH